MVLLKLDCVSLILNRGFFYQLGILLPSLIPDSIHEYDRENQSQDNNVIKHIAQECEFFLFCFSAAFTVHGFLTYQKEDDNFPPKERTLLFLSGENPVSEVWLFFYQSKRAEERELHKDFPGFRIKCFGIQLDKGKFLSFRVNHKEEEFVG